MSEKIIGYDDAYSLKTPEDSIKLYKKWAQTYDKDFALNSNYHSPIKITSFFNKNAKSTDSPILDVGAGTGLVGECLYKTGNKKIITPNVKPFTLITKAMKESISIVNSNTSYMFFENTKGFHFRSLASMYAQKPQLAYTTSISGSKVGKGGVIDVFADLQTILSYNFHHQCVRKIHSGYLLFVLDIFVLFFYIFVRKIHVLFVCLFLIFLKHVVGHAA